MNCGRFGVDGNELGGGLGIGEWGGRKKKKELVMENWGYGR